jgi:aminodeoxyfutalosine deaminase
MIIRARTIVTMRGAAIENGAVAIDGSRIADVGTFAEVAARNRGEIIDLGEQVLLPGLINAHCHLDYTCLRGKIAPTESFADWIRAINTEKSKCSPQDYLESITEGFREAKDFGTTSILNLEAFPQLIARIADVPSRTWWCAELIDVRSPQKAKGIVDHAMEQLRSAANRGSTIGLAPHAPFTASTDLYRRCDEIARRENILLTTHLAESPEETEMFCHGRGPLFDLMKGFGGSMPNKQMTPYEYLSEQVQLDDCWIVAHANELTTADLERMSKAPRFHVVHCPRSHRYFKHAKFPLQNLREIGCNVCLGTDSLASNSNLSLFAEMRALQKTEPSLLPREIIEMATVNSARALQCANKIGQIAPGFLADLIAIPNTAAASDVFEQVVAFENSVSWMMIGGKVSVPSTA